MTFKKRWDLLYKRNGEPNLEAIREWLMIGKSHFFEILDLSIEGVLRKKGPLSIKRQKKVKELLFILESLWLRHKGDEAKIRSFIFNEPHGPEGLSHIESIKKGSFEFLLALLSEAEKKAAVKPLKKGLGKGYERFVLGRQKK